MTDTITESFCERCGTRYSFEQTARRRRGAGIGRVRVLTRGLRNYVANDGMPMDEAMAAAQSDEERAGVSRQLDAFHKTFNFCMSCRQYTCASCWNEKVGECLTCAPDLTREVLPPPFPDLPLDGPVQTGGAPLDAEIAVTAWPTADLARPGQDLAAPETLPAAPLADSLTGEPVEEPAVLARLDMFVGAPLAGEVEDLTAIELAEIETALAAHSPAEIAAAAPAGPAEPEVAAAEPQAVAEIAEPEVAAAAESPAAAEPPTAAEPQPVDAAARATTARGQTRSLLGRFRPARADAAAIATAGAAKAAAAEPEGVAPEPATPAPPAEIEVAAQPAAATAAEPPSAPADTVEQPMWRIVAPDGASPGQSWPDAPAWPTTDPHPTARGQVPGSAATPWASRLATARPEPANVWAASTQEVLAAPGPVAAGHPGAVAIQACVSCGLSLSANARFCRRCGSRQG